MGAKQSAADLVGLENAGGLGMAGVRSVLSGQSAALVGRQRESGRTLGWVPGAVNADVE
jgi:hypothetical protein